MKLSHFILLNEEEKKSAVLHTGILIGKRNNFDHMIFLFQMGNYYVETFCNLESKKVEEYRAFENMKPLNPYLDVMAIEDLIN